MLHLGPDPTIGTLPADLCQLYYAAEVLARFTLNTDMAIRTRQPRYASLVVGNLATLAADAYGLKDLLKPVEAQLILARHGERYVFLGDYHNCTQRRSWTWPTPCGTRRMKPCGTWWLPQTLIQRGGCRGSFCWKSGTVGSSITRSP